jgi:4-aminobutyrate aminotransferase
MRDELNKLAERHECIGDIRIAGLLISIELVKDKGTKERHDDLAERVLYYCLEKGLSFKVSGGNCLTWHPPLVVTREEMRFAVSLVDEAFTALGK